MGLIRTAFSLAFLGLFLLIGFTVPVGDRTLFGHVGNIWGSDEAQELVEGVKDSSGPLVDRVKRGVEAGLADDTTTEQVAPVEVLPESVPPGAEALPAAPKGPGKEPVASTEDLSIDGDTPR